MLFNSGRPLAEKVDNTCTGLVTKGWSAATSLDFVLSYFCKAPSYLHFWWRYFKVYVITLFSAYRVWIAVCRNRKMKERIITRKSPINVWYGHNVPKIDRSNEDNNG